MTRMRACPGFCAMYHECPCSDKVERHCNGGVADTPGSRRSPNAVEGRQLEESLKVLRRLTQLLVAELFHPGSTGL